MKKIVTTILIVSFLFMYFIPLKNETAKAEPCSSTNYAVNILSSNGSSLNKGCFKTYALAKTEVEKNTATSSSVGVIYYNGKIIYSQLGIAKLDIKNNVNTNTLLYLNASDTSSYTYVAGWYGSDAAFIDYDDTRKRAKIKISGFTGWVSINDIEIVPLTSYYSKSVKVVATVPLNVRLTHSTSGTYIGQVTTGQVLTYYDTYSDGTYTWYKIKYTGNGYINQDAWFPSLNSNTDIWTELVSSSFETYYEKYTSGNLIHYFDNNMNWGSSNWTNLGPAPSFMKQSTNYYSFDGIYFYTDLATMLKDYKANNYTHAVNATSPHYPYYLYLPNHSKTNYVAQNFDDIIKGMGYTKEPVSGVTYVESYYENGVRKERWTSADRKGISALVNQGKYFVEAQNTYGTNALLSFSAALNESGNGTSMIALQKKNLFGHNAGDSDPYGLATTYNSFKDSIMAHAQLTSKEYSSPSDSRYFGSHYGNKNNGMGVKYAADPYWGEKMASKAYNNDLNYGRNDYLANTLGIVKYTGVTVVKTPSLSASVIYTIKNSAFPISGSSFVVFDKVYTTENGKTTGWYKVYTDTALDGNQNVANIAYDFNKSYGYIREDYLYVNNHQPVIQASDKTISVGDSFNPLTNVSAMDTEDGNLTSKITYESNVNINVPGNYTITYTVEDNSHYQAHKTISVTVKGSLDPVITASDINISQYTTFDPKKYVSIKDPVEGDITQKVVISKNTVNTNQLGTYQVTYQVTNNSGKSASKTIQVTVVENKKPVIQASNKTISVGDSFNPLTGVTASDAEDGNITPNIQVIQNTVNTSKAGTYQVTYEVSDSASQKTTKTITIIVEAIKYTSRSGLFHLQTFQYNTTTDRLNFTGFLAIKGINNTTSIKATYDFILVNQNTKEEVILPMERWTTNVPFTVPNDPGYNYSGSWFQSNLDLSNVPQGDYTVYVRARINNNETKVLLNNQLFNNNLTKKAKSKTGRGYDFRINYYNRELPIEIFIRDNGLISSTIPPTIDGMYNQFYSMSFTGSTLNIKGTSHSVKGNYASNQTVSREIIFENVDTLKREKTVSIGSITNGPYQVSLRVSDGFDKTRAWYNASIDISSLPKGTYAIYIKTKTGNIEDYGELNDLLYSTINQKTTFNGKTVQLVRNDAKRFRIELIVS